MTEKQKLTTELFVATNMALMHSYVVIAQGMVAENQHRICIGESIAYGEDAFAQVASDLADIAQKLNETYQALERMQD